MSDNKENSTSLSNPLYLLVLVLCALTSLYAVFQMNRLDETVTRLNGPTAFEESLSENSELINDHIDQRIDAYIDRKRKEKVAKKYGDFANAAVTTTTGLHIYGSETARYSLVEFSDLECPYCKKYHATPKSVVDASTGLVNWKWHHLPLPFHNPVATIEAHAAECVASLAGNRAFWVYINEVFTETKGNGQGAGDLVTLAQNMGIDETKFSQCLTSGKFRDKISADLAEANRLGFNSSPITMVVDNKTGAQVVLRGLQSPDSIVSAIQSLKNNDTAAQ